MTAGKIKNERGKNVLSPEQCPEGSWQFNGGTGTWLDDKDLRVEKIGEILFAEMSR